MIILIKVIIIIIIIIIKVTVVAYYKKLLSWTFPAPNNNNSIQFNSIHVYLRANLTAQIPITKLAWESRRDNKQKTYRKCKIRQFI
jgi:hypothetical protein